MADRVPAKAACETTLPGRHQIGTVHGLGLEYSGGIVGIRSEGAERL